LIAVVDSDIRIGVPDENAIDAAITFLKIVQVAIYRVFSSHRIIEIAIFHHHLRLEEAGLESLPPWAL